MRRHRNKIKSIKNLVGEWITDEAGVKKFFLSECKKLFEIEMAFSTLSSDMENFASCFLSGEDGDCLSDPVVEEEIRQGLWALKPFKAPGVDGLHAGFF